MKLLYLWIEEYKNIKQQGFNFSGKYKFNFTPETNEKGEITGGELTCNENNDYIPNFFGKNIDVTAIVGKNGSGKSSLLKVIFYLIYKKHLEYNSIEKTPDFGKLKEVKAFLLFGDEFGYYIFKTNNINNINFKNKSIKEYEKYDPIDKNKKIVDFYSLYFNYMLDTLRDNENETWINKVFHKLDGYQTPLLMEPHKIDKSGREIIDISLLKYITTQRFLRTIVKGKENEFIDNFFRPNKVVLKLNKEKIIKNLFPNSGINNNDLVNSEVKNLVDIKSKNLIALNNLYLLKKLYSKNLKSTEIYKKLSAFWSENYKQDLLKSYNTLINNYIEKNIENYIQEDTIKSKNSDKKYKLEFSENISEYQVYKLNQAINFKKNILDKADNNDTYKNFIEKIKNNEKYTIEENNIKNNQILLNLPPWIDVEFYENDKSFSSLSSGEKTFFNFIMNLIYQLDNLSDINKYNSINLFLDETELGFHPDWQTRYLNEITKALKDYNKKINLIITTHSPLILSDIPKSNVIFLDKDENGNCKVVDGIDKSNTFGANIHTLLADSFFMENGTMGEFAKEKINEVIKLLNQNDLSENNIKYCEQIISVIGEPIIKNQLQRMLDSKRLRKIDEIDKIKEDISKMQKRLKELENNDKNN